MAAVPTINAAIIHAIKYQPAHKVSSAEGERPWLARLPPPGMDQWFERGSSAQQLNLVFMRVHSQRAVQVVGERRKGAVFVRVRPLILEAHSATAI